jgi:hypothetical protein
MNRTTRRSLLALLLTADVWGAAAAARREDITARHPRPDHHFSQPASMKACLIISSPGTPGFPAEAGYLRQPRA